MPKLKARYRVVGPKTEMVKWRKYFMDETGSLQFTEECDEMETYMVYFPMGHSIRVLSYAKLKELGLHIKPRIVDMETGDVVDVGGDPYDFSDAPVVGDDDIVIDDDLTPGSAKRSRKAETV